MFDQPVKCKEASPAAPVLPIVPGWPNAGTERNAFRVLLVEDDPADAELIRRLLGEDRRLSFTLTTVGNIEEAKRALDHENPSVVLLNPFLPDSGGIHSLEVIHAHAPSIPVIVLTGIESTRLAEEAARAGAYDYLEKERLDAHQLTRAIQYATQRRIAEQALRESEERYRGLYENIPLMYFMLDPQGRVLAVNRYGAEQLGYAHEELVGHLVLDVFHPADREAVAAQLEGAIRTPGRVATWEFRKVRKDGSVLWVEEAVRVVNDGAGDTVVLVACEDITERKKADQELVQLTRKLGDQSRILQSILHHMGEGVAVADDTGKCLVFNPMARRILGMDGTDVPATEWTEKFGIYVPESKAPVSVEKLPLVRAIHGETVEDEELLVRNAKIPKGAYISVTGRPLIDEDGTLKGGVIVFRDVTARKRLEESRKRLAMRLLDSQEEERQKISGMLHDHLGQLLTLARMDLESASLKKDDADAHVSATIRRLDEVIRSVRGIARSLRPPLLDDLGLETAMESLLDEFAESSGIRPSFRRNGGTADLSKDQVTCLYRVLQEGLTNILKHAHASEVTVVLGTGGNAVTLDIGDNGKGFDVAKLSGDEERGVGLLGMRERLTRLGGKLRIDSAPNRGTQLRAELPKRPNLLTQQ